VSDQTRVNCETWTRHSSVVSQQLQDVQMSAVLDTKWYTRLFVESLRRTDRPPRPTGRILELYSRV